MNNLHRFVRYLVPSSVQKRAFYKMSYTRTYCNIAKSIEQKADNVPPAFLKLPPRSEKRNKQNYDYFLVLDFEATCDSPKTVIPQEIIEFPVLKVNGDTFETESIFHSYVKPVMNPELTKFCTQLTGITQDIVDDYPVFEDVYEEFQTWMQLENLLNKGTKIAFVTCGDWDLKYIFPIVCKGVRMTVPDYLKKWINVKVSFAELSGTYPRNMMMMMKFCQVQHEGKLHSGLDDCKNLARVLKDLADRGIVYELNGRTN